VGQVGGDVKTRKPEPDESATGGMRQSTQGNVVSLKPDKGGKNKSLNRQHRGENITPSDRVASKQTTPKGARPPDKAEGRGKEEEEVVVRDENRRNHGR